MNTWDADIGLPTPDLKMLCAVFLAGAAVGLIVGYLVNNWRGAFLASITIGLFCVVGWQVFFVARIFRL